MIQNLINHVALVVDASYSMMPHRDTLPKVFDGEIAHLRQRSIDLNQETRISVYTFSDDVQCLVFDMDVMRMPSLAQYYRVNGNTALMDGTARAIHDMEKLPELYGDHAFLVYVLTDGEENRSRMSIPVFSNLLHGLKDHWTLAAMVPNARGEHEIKKHGFPAESVMVWDASTRVGLETAGREFRSAVSTYMDNRAKGIRGTRSFFALKTVNVRDVEKKLDEIAATILRVTKAEPIRDLIERRTRKPYRIGSAFYELTKPEKVQPAKAVCLQHKHSGKLYGGDDARRLLGLPGYEVKVSPNDHGDYRIFVQSTSVNRKLVPGTEVLVV